MELEARRHAEAGWMAMFFSFKAGKQVTRWDVLGEPDPNAETPKQAYQAQQEMYAAIAARQQRQRELKEQANGG